MSIMKSTCVRSCSNTREGRIGCSSRIHPSVAEHVSVPKQHDPEVTRENGTKTERLRVPLPEDVLPVILP